MELETKLYSNGHPLAATIRLPRDDNYQEKKYPTVMLCHGHSRYRNDGLDRLAEVLAENEIATIRFDFRGCGTGADARYDLYCASEWPDDLVNALCFAETLPFVDVGRLGVAGISMGASTAVYVSGIDGRIRSTVAMAGIADCGLWLRGVWETSGGDWNSFLAMIREDQRIAAATGRSRVVRALDMYNDTEEAKGNLILESLMDIGINGYVSLASLGNLIGFRPIEKCAYIACPVFFIHGGGDGLVPRKNSQAMFDAINRDDKKISVYEGIDHNIPRNDRRETVFSDIAAWFSVTL